MSDTTHTPGRHRSFHHYSEAWYFESSKIDDRIVDSVNIAMGAEDRMGCDYSLTIEWRNVGRCVAPRVQAFDDAWLAFAELADVFAWLSTRTGQVTTPVDVCAALLSMGFTDHTERVPS